MIILDHPYVSEFLKDTAAELQIPVLKNKIAAEINMEKILKSDLKEYITFKEIISAIPAPKD